MKPLFAAALLALFFAKNTSAQQIVYNSFYQHNWQLLNPAATDPAFYAKNGSANPNFLIQLNARNQWMLANVPGAPRFAYSSIEYSPTVTVRDRAFTKFGLTTVLDQTDALKTTGVYFNAAFFRAGLDDFFSFGFSPGYVSTSLDAGKLRTADGPYLAGQADPIVAAFEGHRAIEVPLGVFYRKKTGYDNSFYTGLSMPRGLAFNLSDRKETEGKAALRRFQKPHINAIAGLKNELVWDNGNKSLVLEPTLWLRWARGAGIGADLGARAWFDEGFWFGASAGSNTQFNVEGGLYRLLGHDQMTGYRIGIIYGAPPVGKNRRLGNSVELTLAYYWK